MSNSALLYTDILKSNYWDKNPIRRTVFTLATGQKNNLHPFENCFDGSSGTTWRLNSNGSQQKYTFTVTGPINGIAIYGHNLNSSQGLRIIDTSASSNYFQTSPNYKTDGSICPKDSTGRAFCAFDWSSGNITDGTTTTRAISIETINWSVDTFVEVVQLGTFLQSGVDLLAPFNLPLFQTEKIANNIKSKPFFVLWKVPRSGEGAVSRIEDQNNIIYANVNGTLPNPVLDANNLINFKIPIIGFTE